VTFKWFHSCFDSFCCWVVQYLVRCCWHAHRTNYIAMVLSALCILVAASGYSLSNYGHGPLSKNNSGLSTSLNENVLDYKQLHVLRAWKQETNLLTQIITYDKCNAIKCFSWLASVSVSEHLRPLLLLARRP